MNQWNPGTVLAFPTRDLFEWRPTTTGRFAALKILGEHPSENALAIASLAPIFDEMPDLVTVQDAAVLTRDRFAFNDSPSVHFVPPPTAEVATEFEVIGRLEITATEQDLVQTCRSYTVVESLMSEADAEWRWNNERALLEADLKRDRSQRQILAAERQARYETRLKRLTFQNLLSEMPFERWSDSPPYPPEPFSKEARLRVARAISELDALGKRPGKRDTRKIVRNLVNWFNEADAAAGVIETVEREDICEVLEEILHVAKHPSLMDEVHTWRDW